MNKLLLTLGLTASIYAAGAASAEAPQMGGQSSAFRRTAHFQTVAEQLGQESRTLTVFRVNHVIANVDVFSRMLEIDSRSVQMVIDQFCAANVAEEIVSRNEGRPYNIWAVQNAIHDRIKDMPDLYELLIDMLNLVNLHNNPFTALKIHQLEPVFEEVKNNLRGNQLLTTDHYKWENARTMYSEFLLRGLKMNMIQFDVGPFEPHRTLSPRSALNALNVSPLGSSDGFSS